ncbi:MAG: ECF-type sigma factor [Planctomycetota bacterium]
MTQTDQRTAALYDVLHELAARSMGRERAGHTLQPTALVHEAWLRLARSPERTWDDRAQFVAACVRSMRQVLIDHARRRQAARRGGELLRVALPDDAAAEPGPGLDALALDEALTRLAAEYPRAARVVELRFFGGLTGAEIAQVLSLSARTVDSDWAFARAWLIRELDTGDDA